MPKIDLTNYTGGREPAYIKHRLLEEYRPQWAYKVGSAWDQLVYVDGFAGPWQTKSTNYQDTSFGIASQLLRQCQTGIRQTRGRDLQIECILTEQDRRASAQLKRFAHTQTGPGFGVHALCGEFIERIGEIEAIIHSRTTNAFRFVFLDPKGWSDIPMIKLQPFLRGRSCEVLITLMTRHIIRFLDESDRENSYVNLFGRKEAVKNLRDSFVKNEPSHARADRAVREYGRSLRLLCGFKYVSAAVILEPDEESIRYFLVYGTKDPRGIEVFKAAETKAARIQDVVRQDTRIRKTHQPDLVFDDIPPSSKISLKLRAFYSERARNRVLEILSSMRPQTQHPYDNLFRETMSFPLVTENDLVSWLIELEPHVKLKLAGSTRRRKPSPVQDDRVIVINPKSLH